MTASHPGPFARARISFVAWRDARAGVTPDDKSPRVSALRTAAEARGSQIVQRHEHRLLRTMATLARLVADRDSLRETLDALPDRTAPAGAVPASATDQTAIAIRANTRVAVRRTELAEQLRRLDIEIAELHSEIDAAKQAAQAEQDIAHLRVETCVQFYRAALTRHAARRASRADHARHADGSRS